MIRLFGRVFYKKDVHGKLGVVFNIDDEQIVRMHLDKILAKSNGWAFVEIKLPVKPISRGPHSQMNRIHGHCADIAAQLNQNTGTLYTTDDVKEAMKRLAVTERGFPVKLGPDGCVIPQSLSNINTEEATALLETIADFASIHELYLTEVDEHGVPYRTLHGKRIDEAERSGEGD